MQNGKSPTKKENHELSILAKIGLNKGIFLFSYD